MHADDTPADVALTASGFAKAGSRGEVLQALLRIAPVDRLERAHQADAVAWVRSGAALWRRVKPAIPPKHLVAYFAVIDARRERVLLVDHIKAGLWVPSGGHVEPGESPAVTVEREAFEELAVTARFHPAVGRAPLFVTVTVTVGRTAGHTDVSLWYVLEADSTVPVVFDAGEFRSVRWFSFGDVLATELSTLEPHLHRFVGKLTGALAAAA